ncbi:uncharacterized protein LOC124281076 [Haliotis rubra]|uniref:uncharacterized protein LOC124281076 n=1 Tax=Haliotis rubra TaxID=36100 RepID=UPI001EE553FA|nr:uncharacterized protein LOC124281076 [Haliotis rubra]
MPDVLPIAPLHCAIYLLSIVQRSESISPVVNAFYSLRHAHTVIGLVSPTDSMLVKNVLEAAKRKLARSVVKKEPVTVEILNSLFDSKIVDPSLYNLRTISMCLLAYAGFLRSEELLNITRSDIVFYNSHMLLFIEKSKTDVYRDGAWLVIGRTGTKLCPVECLERYLQAASINPQSDVYIFRNVTKYAGQYELRRSNKPMSYTRLRDIFLEALTPFVSDIKRYGSHSLRSGGATAAANNGIPDRMFKRHGRWRSEKAKDGYVKDKLENRIKVSLSLGL